MCPAGQAPENRTKMSGNEDMAMSIQNSWGWVGCALSDGGYLL